jgi:hypothetical protein
LESDLNKPFLHAPKLKQNQMMGGASQQAAQIDTSQFLLFDSEID